MDDNDIPNSGVPRDPRLLNPSENTSTSVSGDRLCKNDQTLYRLTIPLLHFDQLPLQRSYNPTLCFAYLALLVENLTRASYIRQVYTQRSNFQRAFSVSIDG